MDYMDISRRRVTVRRYTDTLVPEEDLLKILEVGRCSLRP